MNKDWQKTQRNTCYRYLLRTVIVILIINYCRTKWWIAFTDENFRSDLQWFFQVSLQYREVRTWTVAYMYISSWLMEEKFRPIQESFKIISQDVSLYPSFIGSVWTLNECSLSLDLPLTGLNYALLCWQRSWENVNMLVTLDHFGCLEKSKLCVRLLATNFHNGIH